MNNMYLWHIHHTFRTTHLLSDVGEAVDKLDVAVNKKKFSCTTYIKMSTTIFVNKQLH